MPNKPQRIVLKLSGEALMDERGDNIGASMLVYFASEIKSILDKGIQVSIVLGAGNIVRGAVLAEQFKPSRAEADYMGMLGTVINSMALRISLREIGVNSRLYSAVAMDQVSQIYIREKVISSMREGRVVILAGGTGNPYFTTDTAAALRAAELNADVLLKGTNVTGVFTGDPNKTKGSKMLDHLTFSEVINLRLRIMDATAFTMCRDQNIPIHVFDIHKPGNLHRVLCGEKIGTRIDANEPGSPAAT